MGPGWTSVAGDAIESGDQLAFWIDIATAGILQSPGVSEHLDLNAATGPTP